MYSALAGFLEPGETIESAVIREVKEEVNLNTENVFPKMSKTPGKIKHLGKNIGHDNEEIFRNWLGLKTYEITQLKKDGII